MVFLELKFNDEVIEVIVDRELVTIGRSKNCTYCIADSNLSSKHCQIYLADGCLYIEDLDSKNGILLNGIKVTKEKIYLSDVLNIGSVILSVDRFKLNPDSIEILTAPQNDDRALNLELTNSIIKLKPAASKCTKDAFRVKNKKSTKGQILKEKLIIAAKYLGILIAFLLIYKLLR